MISEWIKYKICQQNIARYEKKQKCAKYSGTKKQLTEYVHETGLDLGLSKQRL